MVSQKTRLRNSVPVWIYEEKYDGWRMLAAGMLSQITSQSRHGIPPVQHPEDSFSERTKRIGVCG
jgi:ATP-dependent DNA ligase